MACSWRDLSIKFTSYVDTKVRILTNHNADRETFVASAHAGNTSVHGVVAACTSYRFDNRFRNRICGLEFFFPVPNVLTRRNQKTGKFPRASDFRPSPATTWAGVRFRARPFQPPFPAPVPAQSAEIRI